MSVLFWNGPMGHTVILKGAKAQFTVF
ncbi:hypothetical protein F383_39093 [Gossypium arboreum]|uniref:Uncharacterized protein n=1 Tax=Gossypium arboreum TaxID=29729 RepID=A0A0B0MFE4_GOSAR|nr:hypothetical protein F383_39093 [Gossypium arboreum]